MNLYKLTYNVEGVILKFRIAAESLLQAIEAGNQLCVESVGDFWEKAAKRGDYLRETFQYNQFLIASSETNKSKKQTK